MPHAHGTLLTAHSHKHTHVHTTHIHAGHTCEHTYNTVILRFDACLSVCYGSGLLGGQDYSSDTWPSYLLYFVLCVTHSRSSSWSRRSRGAVWSDHTTAQGCWCVRVGANVVKEVRPQKHNYVCSEDRTVVCCTVLTQTEVRAPPTSAPWRAAGAGLLKRAKWAKLLVYKHVYYPLVFPILVHPCKCI